MVGRGHYEKLLCRAYCGSAIPEEDSDLERYPKVSLGARAIRLANSEGLSYSSSEVPGKL